tara:strand:- start:12934 stop:13536 length:603 start_codon:yes stop_codon:yes gene_type:complete
MEKNLADYRDIHDNLSISQIQSEPRLRYKKPHNILNKGNESYTIITIINDAQIVLKKSKNYKIYKQEKWIYLKLNKSGITPDLKYIDDKNGILGLEYVGLAWNKIKNQPTLNYPDLRRQYIELNKRLFMEYNLQHRDRLSNNICFLNNKLKWIDFGHYKDVRASLKQRGKKWDKERLLNMYIPQWNNESVKWFSGPDPNV